MWRFHCEWNSRDKTNHYLNKSVAYANIFKPWTEICELFTFCRVSNVPFPPLQIKLCPIKNFAKVMDRNGSGFLYLEQTFPDISDAKIKEGIFVGPRIRELIKDPVFKEKLHDLEKRTWISFESVVANFLGNHKSEKCKEFVSELLLTYEVLD